MLPFILVRSMRYFIDINPHYSFSCIRKSNYKHKDLLITLLYEILLEQSRTAFDLLEYQKLCSFIRGQKKQDTLLLEEVNAAEKVKNIVIRLKSFIEKMVILIAAAYDDITIDSTRKKHKSRVAIVNKLMAEKDKSLPCYGYLLKYIESESFKKLDNLRTGILHKKGISRLQPHNFFSEGEFNNTPFPEFLDLVRFHHRRNSVALLCSLAVLVDRLIVDVPRATKKRLWKKINNLRVKCGIKQ